MYTAASVEVATAKGSGGDAFTQKILYLTFVHDHEVLPSILYIIWLMLLQSLQRFRRRYTSKKPHARTYAHGHGHTDPDELVYPFFYKKKRVKCLFKDTSSLF